MRVTFATTIILPDITETLPNQTLDEALSGNTRTEARRAAIENQVRQALRNTGLVATVVTAVTTIGIR